MGGIKRDRICCLLAALKAVAFDLQRILFVGVGTSSQLRRGATSNTPILGGGGGGGDIEHLTHGSSPISVS